MSNELINSIQNLLVDTVIVIAVIFYTGMALALLYIASWSAVAIYRSLRRKREL
jgi:hypothetical protein